ncbi:MAG: InlB B-repeat-containing protein, partial [Bifidobacterium crudilactis]
MTLKNWKIGTEYNITYDLGDVSATNTLNPATYLTGELPLTLQPAALSNYSFAGWYTASNFSGSAVTAIPVGSTGDKTYYAKWTYQVSYDGNSNTSGSVPSQSVATVKGAAVTLASNSGSLARTGYTFDGWNTNAAGTGTSYAVSSSQTFAGNTTLYAKWKIATYNITYELNGGTNHASNPATYTVESLPLTLQNPTLSGFTFAGWYTEAGFVTKVTSIPVGSTGAKKFYAKWTYQVTYNANSATSGSVPAKSAATVKGAAVTLATNTGNLARTGYVFAGWNSNAAGTGTSYAVSSSQTFAGNTTVYARWVTEYAITYELNGVSVTNPNPTAYSEASLPVALSGLSNTTAYTFAGWYESSSFTGSAVTSIPVGSTGAKTFYAKWTYRVTYDKNSSTSGSAPGQSAAVIKGAAVTLAANSGSLARTGYRFAGWNTAADGTGTSYAVSSSQTLAGNTTLYARWVVAHSTAGGSFEYRIDVTNASAQVIVPANGRSTGVSTYNVAYAWYVEVSDDRSTWTPLDCSAISQTAGGGSCGSGVQSESFTGTSASGTARGPVLGTMAVGGHWIRLVPVTSADGWLRAFATYGSATHQSGTLITEVGDIPFKGLDGTVGASTTAGSFVGYSMFRGAVNLVTVGKVFDSSDVEWASVADVGARFAASMFYGNANLRQIGASTSLSTTNITSVGGYFFNGTFDSAATASSTAPGGLVLPSGAFDIGNIASAGTYFFGNTFTSAAKLSELPAGSFHLSSNLTTAGDYFFTSFISGANGLTQLPQGSFNTQYLTTARSQVFSNFHSNSSAGVSRLETLPSGSFKFGPGLTSVAQVFLKRAFYNAGMLRALPAGSFDATAIASVGSDFMSEAFGGATVAGAPKLERSDIRRVAATWHLDQTNLDQTAVLYRTFYSVEVGGSLEESDAAQLLVNPPDGRQTFTGTRMCSASVNRANYGLLDTCTVLQRFEFEVSVSAADADTTSLVVPTNGRGDSDTSYGQAYSWKIDINDGSGWMPVDCSATPSLAAGGCDGTDSSVFVGTSANGVSMGPDLGTRSEGSYWVRLRPAAATVPVGWLRAFATYGSVAHRTASWITRVRDIPFKGLDGDANAANAGVSAGFHLLHGAVNLSEIGSVLDRAFDPDWASVSNATSNLFDSAFDGAQLTGLPEDAFDIQGMVYAGNSFLRRVLRNNTKLTELPVGSFDTGQITFSGEFFLGGAFEGASSLEELPAGSLELNASMTSVGYGFFSNVFNGASTLVELPEGSFDTRNIATVGSAFFFGSFKNASSLEELPADSLVLNASVANAKDLFFADTFSGASSLKVLPEYSFNISSIGTVGDHFFSGTFSGVADLAELPEHSFDISGISTAGISFFYQTFRGASALVELPEDSFRLSPSLTSVGTYSFHSTFMNAVSLRELPEDSFNTESLSVVGTNFFRDAFNGASSLAVLPDGAFSFASGLVSVPENFFYQTFTNAGSLSGLPSGAFDVSNVATVEYGFMYMTFGGETSGQAPKLRRADILPVVTSWSLDQANLNKNAVFMYTFRNVATASGSLEESDATQIALNPSAAKNTFTGTRLCTSSANYVNWGLSNLCDFSYFDFKIRVSAEDAAGNKPVIVPTVVSSSTAYAWRISVSSNDGVTWQLQDCDGGGISYTGGGCGTGANSVAYEGAGSAMDAAAGPNLGVFAQGEYWVRLEPVVESAGWLRGFGVMKDVSSVAPSLAEWIVEVGDIPFLGLKDPAVAGDATQAGDRVGAKMFPAASNLARVGRFLHEDDPAWASVTTVGVSFLDGMFRNADSLGVAGADGSYDLSKIETVGSLFMQQAFNSTGLTSLPAGSFDTGQIRSVGSIFMNNAFAGTRLTGLPVGSFSFSAMLTAVPDQFLMNTFNGVDTLGGLPAGSFEMSHITSVGANFMNGAFTMMSAASGGSLPYEDVLRVAASWKLSQSELDKTNVLRGTFGSSQGVYAGKKLLQYQVEQLKLQPGGVATDMRYTFANTQLCTDSPFFAQYGLEECEPPHALPYTGSAAVWWWVLTVAVLLLSVPTVLARG